MTKQALQPIIYTYPFGAYSEETTDMLKSMGFKMSLTCNEGINHITDADSLFMLKDITVQAVFPPLTFAKWYRLKN